MHLRVHRVGVSSLADKKQLQLQSFGAKIRTQARERGVSMIEPKLAIEWGRVCASIWEGGGTRT